MATTLERGLRRLARAATCAVAFAACLGMMAPSAYADEPGRWPVENDVVRNAWKQGIDGSGITIAVLDDQPIGDYPGLADADITYQVGSFREWDSEKRVKTQCIINGKPMTATLRRGEDSWQYTHGTDMLAWIAGNGKDYDGKTGLSSVVFLICFTLFDRVMIYSCV